MILSDAINISENQIKEKNHMPTPIRVITNETFLILLSASYGSDSRLRFSTMSPNKNTIAGKPAPDRHDDNTPTIIKKYSFPVAKLNMSFLNEVFSLLNFSLLSETLSSTLGEISSFVIIF